MGAKIGFYLNDNQFIEGILLDVKQDHLVIHTNLSVFYLAANQIQALSNNAKDFRISSEKVPYLNKNQLTDILDDLKYNWVTINCLSNRTFSGLLSKICEDHIILVNNADKLYVKKSFISNIYKGVYETTSENVAESQPSQESPIELVEDKNNHSSKTEFSSLSTSESHPLSVSESEPAQLSTSESSSLSNFESAQLSVSDSSSHSESKPARLSTSESSSLSDSEPARLSTSKSSSFSDSEPAQLSTSESSSLSDSEPAQLSTSESSSLSDSEPARLSTSESSSLSKSEPAQLSTSESSSLSKSEPAQLSTSESSSLSKSEPAQLSTSESSSLSKSEPAQLSTSESSSLSKSEPAQLSTSESSSLSKSESSRLALDSLSLLEFNNSQSSASESNHSYKAESNELTQFNHQVIKQSSYRGISKKINRLSAQDYFNRLKKLHENDEPNTENNVLHNHHDTDSLNHEELEDDYSSNSNNTIAFARRKFRKKRLNLIKTNSNHQKIRSSNQLSSLEHEQLPTNQENPLHENYEVFYDDKNYLNNNPSHIFSNSLTIQKHRRIENIEIKKEAETKMLIPNDSLSANTINVVYSKTEKFTLEKQYLALMKHAEKMYIQLKNERLKK